MINGLVGGPHDLWSGGSSNINEVISAVLNFFIQKFHNHKKAQNAYKRTKIKNVPKKHLRGK